MDYNYASLRTKYQNFMVPVFELKVDGQNLTGGLGCVIQGLNVLLNAKEADSAGFQICSCYDPETRSIKKKIADCVKLGAKVEICLGYGSSLTKVFAGYIDDIGVSMNVSEAFILSVTAYDAVKLMKESGKRCRELHVATYGEAFEQVMDSYSRLCTVKAEGGSSGEEMALFQRSSDYEFVQKKLVETLNPDFEFLISAGVAYFRKKDHQKAALMRLCPGEGLQSFQGSLKFLNRSLTVLGLGAGDELLSGNSEAASDFLSDAAVREQEVILASGADTQDKVDEIAKHRAKELETRKKKGSISVTGLPELRPGEYIEIGEIGSMIDGRYSVVSVRHTIGADGFQSEVILGG